MGAGVTILGAVITVLVVGGGYLLYQWIHWGTWVQPNTYTGIISSFGHVKGYLFGQTKYSIEFYGGSNISWYSKQFTLAGGFVPQPVNISKYNIASGMNCTFEFQGQFLNGTNCGVPKNGTKPAWG